jgi:hypothetical protein
MNEAYSTISCVHTLTSRARAAKGRDPALPQKLIVVIGNHIRHDVVTALLSGKRSGSGRTPPRGYILALAPRPI